MVGRGLLLTLVLGLRPPHEDTNRFPVCIAGVESFRDKVLSDARYFGNPIGAGLIGKVHTGECGKRGGYSS